MKHKDKVETLTIGLHRAIALIERLVDQYQWSNLHDKEDTILFAEAEIKRLRAMLDT